MEAVPAAAGLALEPDLAVELEVVPPASGNIVDVDREAYPGRLVAEAGTGAEKREDESEIASQPETEVGSTAEMQGGVLVIVWMTQDGPSAKSEAESQIYAYLVAVDLPEVPAEACPVAAARPEEYDRGKRGATEVCRT